MSGLAVHHATMAPLDVLMRTTRFAIVSKPSGLSVHRGWDPSPDNAMRRARGLFRVHVYPVHRLDRGTSGALVMALDAEAAGALGKLFARGEVDKEYVALVRGAVDSVGTIDRPLKRKDGDVLLDARTEVACLARLGERLSLVSAAPRTGRLHQIRRHLKGIGRPVLGDSNHGDLRVNRAVRDECGLQRLALHARRIRFDDPFEEQRVDVVAPLPPDLRGPLERLGFDPALLDVLDGDAGASTSPQGT